MELVIGIIVGAVMVTILVALHELGHAVAARRNGVVVEEFGIGFPPRAWSKKFKNRLTNYLTKNHLLFSLNWLPLGGFVKLQGEHDAASKKGDYGAATFWQKTKILLAGVTINWLTAVVLFTVLAFTGLPKILPDQFSIPSDTRLTTQPVKVSVLQGSAADKGGIKTGDEITNLAGRSIVQSEDLSTVAKAHKNQVVDVVYVHAGATHHTTVKLGDNKNGQGYLGVSTAQQLATIHATWSAPIVGVGTTIQLTGATFQGLGQLLTGLAHGISAQFSSNAEVKKEGNQDLEVAKQSVSGPVGIYGVLFPAATQAGPTMLIFITAVISLSLAVMNVLPIPGLDGGTWFTMAVFRLIKKPLTRRREEAIRTVGYLVLLTLIVVVTIVDVSKFI